MAAEMSIHDIQAAVQESSLLLHKRNAAMMEEGRYEDPSVASLPSFDKNTWYYPSHGYEDADARYTSARGNWGRKTVHEARWVRRGKIAPWSPGMEDWEEEDRARKRIKLLLPPRERSPSPSVILPHLRSPSPPITAPYPTPATQHLSYTSFVMDKAVTSSFRSRLLDELENATNSLIEGEATVRRALGRLWQVMNEDPEHSLGDAALIPKREDEAEDEDEKERRLGRAPDLTPVVHKLFLSTMADRATPGYEGAPFAHPEIQLDSLEKSLASLRELQDDGREYVERLEEIRDGIGDVRTQRNGVWDMVRKKAIAELQEAAANSATAF